MVLEDTCLLLDGTEAPPAQPDAPSFVPEPKPGELRERRRFAPAVPKRLADTGLATSIIEQLILKLLYFKGDVMGSDLARAVGLEFSLIEELIDDFKLQQLVQVKSSLGYGPISALLTLTERGRQVARDYLEVNQYVGPAPVPVPQYCAAVEAQRMPPMWLTQERLAKVYSHMIMTDAVLNQIGPAVASGKSLLIYGQPGNGKTHIAEALSKLQSSDIYVPYALESQGNIIQLFDPIYHELVDRGENNRGFEHDGRWARCRRPFIASGGELSLAMLDLTYNTVSKVYDAPFQLKANNGTYLIDDFGRQKATSTEILNRWIVPMERRIDYLSFLNGGKMIVPFETFLLFSTNVTPDKLGDEAFLRRIQYKMLLRSPAEDEFRSIFCTYCESKGLVAPRDLVDGFIAKHYRATRKQFRRCHPRDVISQAIDYIHFKRLPYELTEDLLDQAFASCFLPETELSEG